MDIRKVQVTGGSSYVLTLPKNWITSLKIKKNDSLGILIQSDGTLLITPRLDTESQQKVKEFDVSTIDDPVYLFRYLIGAYEAGYSQIKLHAEKGMPLFVRSVVREFTQMTIGQEVIEETDTSITLKDLLNLAEMPFKSTIQRMYIIVKNMNENAIKALKEKDLYLAKNVISGDNDVDRLNWLIGRQHSIVLRDPVLAKKLNTQPETVSQYYLITKIIKRIGDHSVKVAENSMHLIEANLDAKSYKKLVEVITSATEYAQKIFYKAIRSFFKKDIKGANKNIEEVKNLITKCEEINALALKHKGLVAISVGYIEESIRRMGEYSANLSEYVINYLIGEQG
jgi:phosphate uptake regulator